MNTNIYEDFQICISAPLTYNSKNLFYGSRILKCDLKTDDFELPILMLRIE